MHNLIRTYISLSLYILLAGCANSIYFYETEKISLTVEARPDSTQPVQGNLGIKQRVALIVPKMNTDQGVGGEALSTISSFIFKITPESGTIFNPVLIQTAFITGDAAASLNDDQAKKAAEAIMLDGVSIDPPEKHAQCVIDKAQNFAPSKLDLLKQIVKKESSKDFSDGDWKSLIEIATSCGISDRVLYADSIHRALQKKLNN